MARSKVVLPPDSTGQAMGVTTFNNGTETVAAPETVLVTPTGTPITPTTPSDTQPISAATLPLPSGAATAAKQPALGTAGSASADVLSVQGISGGTVLPVGDGGGSLTIDGTVGVSGAVETELTTQDYDSGAGTDTVAVVGLLLPKSGGAVAGGTSSDPIRTDPTGTTAQPITDNGGSVTVDGTFWQATQPVSGTFWQATQPVSGTVTANAGTGTLAVSLAAGATAPAKAEDAASADADVGIPAMAVRKATPANTSGTDGDYEMLQMSAGRLWASATLDAALPAGTNNIGDVDVLTLPALPAGTNAIGKLAANDGVDVGDVTINNASGGSAVNVQDGGNSLTVDNGGTFAVQDSQVVADNAAFTDGTTKVFAAGFIFDEVAGTALTENDAAAGRIDSKRAQVLVLEDATTRGQRAAVSAAGALRVDPTGTTTQPVSGTVTASNVTGNVAHDGVDSGNPVLQGFQAIAHGTNPTAVAAADRTVGYANRAGVPFVMGGHPNVITRRDPYTAAQTDTALVTVSAGTKIVVTRVLLTCANSNTVDVSARVGFGAANTPTGAGVVASHPGIPKGGGFNTGDGSGILGVGADGEDLRFTCSVPTTGSIEIVTSYYTIES